MEAANTMTSTSAMLHTKHAARIEVALDIVYSFMSLVPLRRRPSWVTVSLNLTHQESVSTR